MGSLPASPVSFPVRSMYPWGTLDRRLARGRVPETEAYKQALWRTRTADPLLTMEVQGREARPTAGTRGHEVPAYRHLPEARARPHLPAVGRENVPPMFPNGSLVVASPSGLAVAAGIGNRASWLLSVAF